MGGKGTGGRGQEGYEGGGGRKSTRREGAKECLYKLIVPLIKCYFMHTRILARMHTHACTHMHAHTHFQDHVWPKAEGCGEEGPSAVWQSPWFQRELGDGNCRSLQYLC